MVRRFLGLVILLALPVVLAPSANAREQKYICVVLGSKTGILYDCGMTTVRTSDPRVTGVEGSVGPVPDALYGINPYTGHSTQIGETQLSFIQGSDLRRSAAGA